MPTETVRPGRTFKGTSNLPKQAGVSTYLALTFGTLLSSQGTDASFVLTLSGFPPGFPFGLAFPTLSDSFVSDSRSKRALCGAEDLSLRFPVLRFRVSLSGGSNLTRLFFVSVSGPNLIPVAFGVAFAFRRIRLYQKF
ncbi:hypothetical protein OHA79_33140 [Streptomyces sp. NBC_00841]|uniref:hypothetical protein n=1 Tax=Streptomyces sp. NBC_00841 TaxID=2975847 RepID=UPI002DDC407B|nr:hypothetical protein [Streptomyces sp. NBC_00841]WSA02266.1 hypothetical protein OHA79_33140 [Streptomyces sp. NBC_00841]